MKHVLLGLAACAGSLVATAQSFHCDTDRRRAEMIAADPTYLEREAAYAVEIRAMIRDNAQFNRDGDLVVTLPIVFHVLNMGGNESITDEQIFSQVDVLNEDYRALNTSVSTVHPAFRDLVGDAKIQFAMPTLDPNGNCTNGIDRVRTSETFRGEQESKVNPWPRDKYINVWITRTILSGAAGYAHYPDAWEGPFGRIRDGIMIRHDYIGNIGTSNPRNSHALSHEIGHFLNLPHVWGFNNGVEPGEGQAPLGHMVPDCGDDDVDDTPRSRGWKSGFVQCNAPNDVTWGWATDCNALMLSSYAYQFNDVTTTSGTTDPTVVVNPSDEFQGATRERTRLSSFTAHGVSANPTRNEVFSFTEWPERNVNGETNYGSMPNSFDANKYYSFTITPLVTDQLFLDSIGFKISRNANGIRNFSVRSSVNNYASNLVLSAAGNPHISTHPSNIGFITSDEAFSDLQVYVKMPNNDNRFVHGVTPVTFHFYGWNAETSDAVARVCSNSAPVDLFKRLGGGPQSGGTWSGPSATDGLFDPATMEAGTYTYTVDATESCPASSATVEVFIEEAPETPVITGDASICAGGSTVLTSSVTSNIRWSTGQSTATISVNSANTYTVSTTVGECTSTSAPITVSVVEAASAGTGSTLSICAEEGSVAVPLFASLRGTPAEGGTWSGPSEVIDGMYAPDTMDEGEYVYTVDGTAPCPAATAIVTVTEVAQASAGTNSTASICGNISADLFPRLNGGPQPGGQWYTPSNVEFDGVFDAPTMAAGAYRYEVDLGGACGSSSATLTVTRANVPAVPTISGNTSFCEGGNVLLVSSSNINNRWSPGGATTPGFRVSAPGSYTVRVTNSSGCSSVSAPVEVTMATKVNAGGDGQLVTCDEGPGVSLYASLQGTPNEGGTWSGPSDVVDGMYQPGSMEPGLYRYVVTATSPCLNDTAYVAVSASNTLALTPGTFGVDDVVLHGYTSLVENVENYMEYAYCDKMFTLGQVERMRAALFSSVGERSSLWSDATLQATGIAEGYEAACPPQADFYSRTTLLSQTQATPFTTTVCAGETVQFVDISGGGRVSTREWSFEGGSPATSTERNPVVTFDTPGFKSVTLTVSNENGSTSKTDAHGVLIGGSPYDFSGLYRDDFEGRTHVHPWYSANYDNNHTWWRHTTGTGYQSNSCVMLNSGSRNMLDLVDQANGGDYDDLISPTFNLSHMTEASFSFRYAYSTQADTLPQITERLEVTISTDCGKTWSTMPNGEIYGAELVNNGNNPQQPLPAWTLKTMPLSSARRAPNVRFRFRFISSPYSNNLYIDDINISGVVGIEDLSTTNFMNLYPNPTNDRFTLGVHGMDRHETSVTITDLRGAVVHRNILAPTSQPLDFSATELGLADGLYLINASNAEGRHTQKLLVGR